jgi:nitrite reductase/ring-hydroxylating ferredoxin subunit/DMSO/TMAO reductase YedYZ heme-binding membrane subunit
MSAGFQAVQWNGAKLRYDVILLGLVALYLAGFIAIAANLHPPADRSAWIDLRIKSFGSCAFLMLSAILAIGPLARLNARFLPLLYNRRHLGVATFFVALAHAGFMVEWYVMQGSLPNLAGELTSWEDYANFPTGFPFKTLGLIALLCMLVMAATSHDYWLAFLSPPVWKTIHMAVYVGYGAAALHIALGAMQSNRHPLVPILLFSLFGAVTALHLLAARKGAALDEGPYNTGEADMDGWLHVGAARDIPDGRARIVAPASGERIAVFRDGRIVSAVSNVCAHQNGPVGEGRVVDGCITCPWHGYEYRVEDGCAPPPFTEKLATYRLRLRGTILEVQTTPLPPGTNASLTLS